MESLPLRIGLIDVDLLSNGTRHPNLALMKISTYCMQFGEPKLIFSKEDLAQLDQYDCVIMSKVFTFSKNIIEIENIIEKTGKSLKQLNICIVELMEKCIRKRPKHQKVAIGGTGFFSDGGRDLHPIIEHIMPDYQLYSTYVTKMIDGGRKRVYFNDYLDYSIGFATRGCFRKCDFCVNKKYDRCTFHAHISEFVDDNRSGIYLWDDNIFACKDWEVVFNELKAIGKPFQFRQGLDIRLLSEKKAKIVAQSRYAGDVIFAFDHVDDYELIERKLKLWRQYSKKPTKLYVLSAFDSWEYSSLNYHKIDPDKKHLLKINSLETQEQRDLLDIEGIFIRISLLMKYGCMPYIMRFEKYKDSKYRGVYIQLARWCNQPQFYKKMSFREFCEANQRYSKSGKICASMVALLLLEEDAPHIAEKFFDMKYEDMKIN